MSGRQSTPTRMAPVNWQSGVTSDYSRLGRFYRRSHEAGALYSAQLPERGGLDFTSSSGRCKAAPRPGESPSVV